MPAAITAEDLYRFRWIDHVRLSKDGERVAYQLSWADSESRQNRSRVVVRRLLEPEPVEATAGVRRDHSPEWSPDGRRVVFLSRRGGADQLFVLDMAAGGDAVQVSSLPDGVSSPRWSPDGSQIAFLGAVLADPDTVVDDPRAPEGKDQVRRAPVARIARRLDYKHDGQGYIDGRYHHLFVVPAGGGEARQVTSGIWDVTGFDWSPDGQKLVVSGNAEPNADLQRALNLYIVDLAGNRAKLVGGFYLGAPTWSPRGDLIAFVAPNGLDAGLLERLWVVPSGGGNQHCLTIGFDQAIGDSVITDMRAGHGTRLRWSSDGERISFLASSAGSTGVYSTDLEGKVTAEVGGQRRIYDFDAVSGVLAFCASDTGSPGELHMLTQGAEARLTDLNPWLRDRYVAQPERHSFTAPDGWVLEGWVLKPDGFDPSRSHPLVMQIHGGPHGQYGWAFFHEFQILAGMGYVVFYVNPRGSDGYGEHFRRQVVRDWGGKDYVDLMSSLDQLVESTGYIDPKRMGIGGGSYGGYMTNWVIGQTDRFAAAASMRSISNLVSEYAQHDIVLWGVLELGPPPWPDLDELWKRSPIRYVQNMKTPLLLTAGEMDLRCAMSQSEELFGAMRFLGKTVELVRFPEESHDLSRTGRPDRRVERLRRIAGWFERFLGTAASERVSEAATQVLPVARVETPAADEVVLEPQPEPIPVVAEEAPMAEPMPEAALETEDLLVFSEPEPTTPEAEAVAPEIAVQPDAAAIDVERVAIEAEPVTVEPEPVAVEPEAVAMEPEPEAVDSESVAIEPEAVAVEPEAVGVEPEPEPAAAEPEPVAIEPEAVAAESEAAQPESEAITPTPEPTPAEPVSAFDEAVAPAPVEPAADPVARTVLAWPSRSPTTPPENGSGGGTGEEATSIIPAWQPAEAPSDSKRTVSLQAMPTESIAAGESFAAKLTFETGPFAGRIVALPDTMVTVGRAPDNDLMIGDPATSGRHGRIEVRQGAFWISDLGSTNGTLVNGEPVIEKQLNDGDLIAIGQNTIRFTVE
jgi:dipeptidyl aminopeptidase/acylaminoacyl peptidase